MLSVVAVCVIVGLFVLRNSLKGPDCGFGCPAQSVSNAPGP